MPSVASEVSVQQSKRPEPGPGRANPSARTPSTPFDQVLDATTSSPPPRTERPERSERPDRQGAPDRTARTDDAPPSPDPAQANAPATAPKVADKDRGCDQTPAAADPAPAADAVPVPAAAPATADTSKTDAFKTDASAQVVVPIAADADEAKTDPGKPAKADDGAPADPAAAPAPTPAAAAIAVPAVAVPAVAVPVAVVVTADPVVATGNAAVDPAPAIAAVAGGNEPAKVQSPQVGLAADAKAEPKADEASPKAASSAPVTIAEAAEPASPAAPAAPAAPATAEKPAAADNKSDKPKIQAARDAHAAAPARPAAAPAAQGADKAPDAVEKPAAPSARAHEPIADRVARATVTEARDLTPTPVASTASATLPNANPVNPTLSVLATPALSPLTALRVDTRSDAAVPVAGLAVEIVSRAEQGLKRFDIRLDPPDLGRIDVRLDVERDGRVTSRLIVERAETLDLLRRDAPQLERALQQAGLKTDGGIDFSLRDQSQSFRDQAPRDSAPTTRLIVPDDDLPASDAVRGYGRMIGLGGGIDIRV